MVKIKNGSVLSMILDNLKNEELYDKLSDNLKKAFDFMLSDKPRELPVGKYEIDGDNVYVMIQTYTTRPVSETKWESHKKYIDLQYIVEGSEEIGWMPIDGLSASGEYDAEKDKTNYNETEHWTRLEMNAGDFTVLYPEDGHKACGILEKPSEVKKAVIKIKLD